jgi:leucyl/phenylalanyl-tRNA--protein transferase
MLQRASAIGLDHWYSWSYLQSRVWIILDKRLWFPDPRRALNVGAVNGLVALGGDLSVPRLLLAYRSGIFPWSVDPITWWSPDPRGIFDLDQFHVSRSLARVLRKARLQVTFDEAFQAVMEACATPAAGRTSSWISPGFIAAYVELHRSGHAHSVECWLDEQLVGGVYGVQVGSLFAGESMFHRVNNASKVALYWLVKRLKDHGFTLFDIQMVNAHTRQLGACTISRDEYLARLQQAVQLDCVF